MRRSVADDPMTDQEKLNRLASLPVVSNRRDMDAVAACLLDCVQLIDVQMHGEGDAESAAQLIVTIQALGACAINLTAYARGRVPQVAGKPNVNIIV